MAAEPLPHELTDEALAKIAWRAYIAHDDDEPDLAVDPMLDVARAVRAALQPAVPPLAPGETVTIPDAADALYGLRLQADDRPGRFSLLLTRGGYTGDSRDLDAAGVAALRDMCDRWLAAQNETSGVRKSLESATGAEKA